MLIKNPDVKKMRHLVVNGVAHDLMVKGIYVYSPLTHVIPINELGIDGNWLTWKEFNHAMLSRCNCVILLKLPGWENSKGVAAELEYARSIGLSIEEMDPPLERMEQAKKTLSLSLKELIRKMLHMYADRDWEQYHSPKNLAMNVGAETAEILEIFRWISEEEIYNLDLTQLQKTKEEIGDVFISIVHLANALGIDSLQAAHEKLAIIGQRYPIEKCKGKSSKYTEYVLAK